MVLVFRFLFVLVFFSSKEVVFVSFHEIKVVCFNTFQESRVSLEIWMMTV